MADYPQSYGGSYGASYGSHDQQHLPYQHANYQTQYTQQDEGKTGYFPSSSYDTSMSAYQYNHTMPGFSAPPVPSAAPLPIFQGWNQDPIPLPPFTAPHNVSQYAGYQGNEQSSAYYGQNRAQESYHYNAEVPAPYDEGEISEGEFDGGNAAPQHTASAQHATAQFQGNGAYTEPSRRAAYPAAMEHPSKHSHVNDYNYAREPQIRREQSQSYSPYAAKQASRGSNTKENQRISPYASGHLPTISNDIVQNNITEPSKIAVDRSEPPSYANGHPSLNTNTNSQQPAATPLPRSHVVSAAPSKLAEARKRAQSAVLNLWPLEVRFQDYIDEGFDEQLVGRLFDDLGMPRPRTKLYLEKRGSPNSILVSEVLPASFEAGNKSTKEGTEASGGSPNGRNGDGKPPGLLSSTKPSTTTAAALPPKPATTTEKERALQKKLEALRKSREERAQKNAAKNKSKQEAVAAPIPELQALPVVSAVATATQPPMSETISAAQPPQINQTRHTPLPMATAQQAPAIPGLFLNSSTSSPLPSTNPVINPASQRKRPVAADFDTPVMAATSFKRPFGHNRNDQRLVIDVSDEEAESDDGDVEMDLESQADNESPTHALTRMSDTRKMTIQNLPSLSNFPSHKPFTPPLASSAASTPTISQSASKAVLGRPEDLLRKETEIELLKKKIAEAEARRKARQTPSGIPTPHYHETATDGKLASNEDIASKVVASIKMQNLIGIAEDEAKSAQRKLAEVQAAELLKVEELKNNEAEQNRLRREKIAADLPRVDAEVQENQSRLELLRLEMAKVEAAVQKSLEDKRRLAEEMERLGRETEVQLQAQKEKFSILTEEETAMSKSLPSSPPGLSVELNTLALPLRASSQPSDPLASQARQATPPSAKSPAQYQPSIQKGADQPANNANENHLDLDVARQVVIGTAKEGVSADHILEAALQDAVRAEVEEAQALDDGNVDMEDSYAPDPSQLAPDPSISPAVEESGSRAQAPVSDVQISEAPGDESDDYEPPEASPPEEQDSPVYSPSPPPNRALSDQRASSLTDLPSKPAPSQEVEQLMTAKEPNAISPIPAQENTPTKVEHYTPYESPLQYFHAYRFHPEFKQKIAGGLRSMTYSNKIDPNQEFCRYELAGGVCNDPKCEFQHFKNIRLPDDAVLTALGSPDQFSGEQREKFCAGLKQVLNNLRERKIRDFNIIASEIVAHRSKFLGDPSKVLLLEGTSL